MKERDKGVRTREGTRELSIRRRKLRQDKGQGTRDEGRGTRDEGRGTRDEGRGTRDEGQGIYHSKCACAP